MTSRVQWIGGIDGRLVLSLDKSITFDDLDSLEHHLREPPCEDHWPDLEDSELRLLGAIVLFMAILKLPPTRRGTTLTDAARLVDGLDSNSGFYDFGPLFPTSFWFDWISADDVRRGATALAEYLRPVQADAQPVLREAALEFIKKRLELDTEATSLERGAERHEIP